MALLHIPLDDITEANLQALIENGVRETLYIDYKRETYESNDAARREYLADVTSFANAAGGDIVIGMAEGEGVATGIVPFEGDADGELRRLEQMARDGIEPRIIGLRVRVVAVGGGVVFIVRVPKSYNPPHRVTYKGSSRFYARTSGGKYEPNVEELRNLFLAAPHLAERIREFRMERIARIAARETPVPLSSDSNRFFVLHVIPYSAFALGQALSLKQVFLNFGFFVPIGSKILQHKRFNFDGFLALPNSEEGAFAQRAYCQGFRSGAVESVATIEQTPDGIPVFRILNLIRCYAPKYACALQKCGVAPPYVVLVSLLGMKGAKFRSDKDIRADRDQYHFTESVFETLPGNPEETIAALRPTLRQLMNLIGLPENVLA